VRYLSVCSGIEAATVAWRPLDFTPVAFAEIAAFPSAVLHHRFPGVANWGDITKFQDWPDATFDVLVGGTPCQSFSLAGSRTGMDDPRGKLALSYLAILDRYRPAFCLWENVPGVLSSNGGRDFGTFVRGMVERGYGFAYRVLDAQFFGIPQRRRRVFLVGSLAGWQRAAAILFDRESLSGHPSPRREAGQDDPADVSGGLSGHGSETPPREPLEIEVVGALNDGAHNGGGLNGQDALTGRIVPVPFRETADPIAANQAWTYTREGSGNFRLSNVAHIGTAVRRLTPIECERLQGFPDDYTLVPYRGRLALDGPRYTAIGNSMAVPVVAWIGRRMQMVMALPH